MLKIITTTILRTTIQSAILQRHTKTMQFRFSFFFFCLGFGRGDDERWAINWLDLIWNDVDSKRAVPNSACGPTACIGCSVTPTRSILFDGSMKMKLPIKRYTRWYAILVTRWNFQCANLCERQMKIFRVHWNGKNMYVKLYDA